MKIEIIIPDDAVDRIANAIKGEVKRLAQGKNIEIKAEGADLIKLALQGKVDEMYLNTDPEFIAAMKEARKIKDDAQKAAKDKLDGFKK